MECDFIGDVCFDWLLVYLLMTSNKAIYGLRQQVGSQIEAVPYFA